VEDEARYGWGSYFPAFRDASRREIRESLEQLVHDASPEQVRAWDASIPQLQREVGEVLASTDGAASYAAILEYELPMESRRPDVVFLVRGGVVVAELKGKEFPSQADLDQAAAYARDLRCYHRECADRTVEAALVPTRMRGYHGKRGAVHVLGLDVLDDFIAQVGTRSDDAPLNRERFLAADAYCPLPSLVGAARELFATGDLRRIKRAHALTEPAIERIRSIIVDAAKTQSRRLILITGVPGAGKTLVGLKVVHERSLDDLAIRRTGVPAVFLSGNAPLVEVLQYQLKAAGGGGKTFVRGVKDYVKQYSRRGRVPPEHVLVFDEAQRAFDADQVRDKHKGTHPLELHKSEPEYFIEFAERVPEWCVVLGLIGSGQEIHVGEEGGLIQWCRAIEGAAAPGSWTVHAPIEVADSFESLSSRFEPDARLALDTELRFHKATELPRFVSQVVAGAPAAENRRLADQLERDTYALRITRSLQTAKDYLRDRYKDAPQSRFGIIASSRDKSLADFGIDNGFRRTGRFNNGAWYCDPEDDPRGRSCRHLNECVVEFNAQGLELDAVLLAWGTDFRRDAGVWSISMARRYQKANRVRDPHQLRANAYRVLLTRGREAAVVFLPPLREMDETFGYLRESGFVQL
jgi:hypothetical protein